MVGIYKDIKNYRYVRNCFNLVLKNRALFGKYTLETKDKTYYPKMTTFGVLYFWHKIPANTPEDYREELITGHVLPLNEALVAMNMDGIIKSDYRLMAEDENFYYYLIKIIPTFQTFGFWFLIKVGMLILFIWYLINKFKLWQYRELLFRFLQDFYETIKF